MNEPRWIAAPGLFRLILACLVVVNHSIPVHLGPAAVYVFFMLSGYWVYRMWFKEYAHTRQPYVTFLISRLWRLLPVYYVALALFLVGDHYFPAPNHLSTFPHGWAGAHFTFSHVFLLGYANQPFLQKLLLPVWSLDIELQFYLVLPLLIVLLVRLKPAWLPRLILLLAALCGLALFFHSYATLDDQSGAWLLVYFGFFLVGLFTAHLDWKPSAPVAAASLIATVGLVAGSFLIHATRSVFFGRDVNWMALHNPHANLLVGLLCAPYAMATLRRLPHRLTLLGRADRDLGNITYDLYLLHWPVLSVMKHFTGPVHTLHQLPALLLAWITLAPLSWLVYRFIDRPLDIRRRTFVASRLV